MKPEKFSDELLFQGMLRGFFRFIPEVGQLLNNLFLGVGLPLMCVGVGEIVPGPQGYDFVLSNILKFGRIFVQYLDHGPSCSVAPPAHQALAGYVRQRSY
jgi:hypothetical protein